MRRALRSLRTQPRFASRGPATVAKAATLRAGEDICGTRAQNRGVKDVGILYICRVDCLAP